MEILTIILASSVISTFISFYVSKYLQNDSYKKEYYKEIIKKRLEAYEFVERQIGVLTMVVLDEKKPYHMIFHESEGDFAQYQQNLGLSMSRSIWIDSDTINALKDLNLLFLKVDDRIRGKTEAQIVDIAKHYYEEIKTCRIELEFYAKKGIFNLHDMTKLFVNKEGYK